MFAWQRPKDHYRAFTRQQAAEAAAALKVDLASLSGARRKTDAGRVMHYDTMDTLSDPLDYWAEAMSTELEHGKAGSAYGTNVTDDDPLSTARIAAAHLFGVEYGGAKPTPFPTYYDALWWMEGTHEKALELQKLTERSGTR